MNKVEGLHHLAIGTANMKGQIEYFTKVLGMELVALYWMHGVEKTFHGFLRLNDDSCIAFVDGPPFHEIEATIGVTHAGNPSGPCAPGTTQHIALKVSGEDALMAMKDRIRSHGVPVVGPVNHGFCKSIYFAGPEDLTLELSYSVAPINAEAWIDPEVVDLCHISAEELTRFKSPADYQDEGGAVAQPLGSDGPHMRGFPDKVYEAMIAVPDDITLAEASDTVPPVQV